MGKPHYICYTFHADPGDLERMRGHVPSGVAERSFARYVFALGVCCLAWMEAANRAQDVTPPAPPKAREPRPAPRAYRRRSHLSPAE